MPTPKILPISLFNEPVPLTDIWLKEHNSHSIGWSTHTIFNGQYGEKYRECRCYICRSVAREKIGTVKAEYEKIPKKNTTKNTRKINEPFIINGCEND